MNDSPKDAWDLLLRFARVRQEQGAISRLKFGQK